MNNESEESVSGPKEPSPGAPPPDTSAGEAEEVAVDEKEPAVDAEEVAVDDEELREQLEEEIKKVRVEDIILQSTVSILKLAARRIAKEDERDLAQGRAGIDAARALVDHLPDEAQSQVREALAELQMLYAKQAGGGGAEDDEPAESENP